MYEEEDNDWVMGILMLPFGITLLIILLPVFILLAPAIIYSIIRDRFKRQKTTEEKQAEYFGRCF